MKPIIKLENISYSYSESTIALSNISLTINKGEDISIIGHNGSGKSTLGKIIVSLLKPKEGKLIFNDVEITDKNDSFIRDKVGIVFQNPDNQFVGVTVKDDIAFGLENKLIPHDKMDSIINEFASKTGVKELLDKEPGYLSGGQKQRVAIAGILAMLPDLIVLDEALAMLDPRGKKEISKLINDIKKDNPNLTIIRITHDLDEAFYSDRVILLNKGNLILDDTPINVFKNIKMLQELGLSVPFIVELNDKLMKEGLIKKENYSLNELVNDLCK